MKLKGIDYLDISSQFSEDEIIIQHSVREFVDNEVMPIIDEHFKNATFPEDLIPLFADMNLLGVNLPEDLDFTKLSSELTVPKNLEDLAKQNQIGLVMLKIVEIIGEDKVKDLDPETVYFLNKILNKLNLKKIRNNILSEVLPARV